MGGSRVSCVGTEIVSVTVVVMVKVEVAGVEVERSRLKFGSESRKTFREAALQRATATASTKTTTLSGVIPCALGPPACLCWPCISMFRCGLGTLLCCTSLHRLLFDPMTCFEMLRGYIQENWKLKWWA